jgi:hypothetical protein
MAMASPIGPTETYDTMLVENGRYTASQEVDFRTLAATNYWVIILGVLLLRPRPGLSKTSSIKEKIIESILLPLFVQAQKRGLI